MNLIFRFLLLLGTAMLLPVGATAQAKPLKPSRPAARDTVPAAQRIRVDHANTLEYLRLGDTVTTQKLIGEVELSQDSIFMYCDSAYLENSTRLFAFGKEVLIQQGDSIAAFSDTLYYNSQLKIADLIGNVVLINGTKKLFTDKLHYDLNTKIATYETPATITDGETQLSSKKGYYYTESDDIFFKDSVVVIHPRFQLRADTLQFNTTSQIATFLGPTVMRSDSTRVYCEAGFYDVGLQVAEFRENAQYIRGQQQATAEIIRYDGTNGIYSLEGNADFKEGTRREARGALIRYDEKNDITTLEGNAFFRDSTQVIRGEAIRYDAKRKVYKTAGRSRIEDGAQVLQADAVDYSEADSLGIASGNVIWQDTSAHITIQCDTAVYKQQSGYLKATGGNRGRPLLITILEGDSLFLTADTLLSLSIDTLPSDSNRLLLAYHDVRIFKTDLQALCDSLSYSTADSLFKMFRAPIIWSDTSQFTADVLHLQLANEQLDKIFLYNNSFIINSPDELFFNQIKGRDIIARFDSSELRQMDVLGNAQSVYYPRDDSNAYVGVNKTVCSDMVLFFEDNQVGEIIFMNQLEGKLEPMTGVDHEALQLEGFNWQTSPPRPRSFDDLFGPPLRTLQPAARGGYPGADKPGSPDGPPPPKPERSPVGSDSKDENKE
ncbi:MAG: OstA-like protein [Saprospiraceae bacterium]